MNSNCTAIRRIMNLFGLVTGALLFVPTISSSRQSQTPSHPSTKNVESAKPPKSTTFHEDWSTLTLDHSTLGTETPKLADKGNTGTHGFIRERYMVNWRPVDPFDLYVILPKGIAKPPVILYLYSFPDDSDPFKNDAWCERAVSGGYAAVGFVSALTGHRTRYRLGKEWFVSELQEALASTTHDVQMILNFLATRSDLDTSRVGMFGIGSGGSIAILASAADPRIRVVDVLGAWGDWPGWLAHSPVVPEEERANFLKPEFLAKVTSLDPVEWLPQMKAKIVRIQDIRKNKSMPDESQERLEAAAPGFAIVNEYGNGRAFLREQPAALTLQWIKDQLRSDATLAVSAEKSERVHFYPAVEAPAQNWPNLGTGDAAKTEPVSKQKDKKEKDNR